MKKIDGREFTMGSSNESYGHAVDNEYPQINVKVNSFHIDETTVTNNKFRDFIDNTGYITEAEKIGWSFVFHYFLSDEEKLNSKPVPGMMWWYAVEGANWEYPEGNKSVFPERANHPVVQVSHNDAVAYCKWAGKRLPTEAEWEYAAKGGTDNELFPWGEEFYLNDEFNCNIWQGDFPHHNEKLDGYVNTAPVKTYQPNGYGLYQMIGNVWEWCANPARIDLNHFNDTTTEEFWEKCLEHSDLDYATRGGSFLCHPSYCQRYRIAARNGNSAMSAASNIGFRCVK